MAAQPGKVSPFTDNMTAGNSVFCEAGNVAQIMSTQGILRKYALPHMGDGDSTAHCHICLQVWPLTLTLLSDSVVLTDVGKSLHCY